MENEKAKLKGNPRDSAGFFSKLTYVWLLPFYWKGYKQPIEIEDLYSAQKEDASQFLGDLLSKNWDQEVVSAKKAGRRPNYVRALFRTFGRSYCLLGLLALAEECVMRVGQPLCLGGLIHYFNQTSGYSDNYVGILFAIGIVFGSLFYTTTHHLFFWGIRHTGMKLRIASCSLIYRKALRVSRSALGKTTAGQIVNLLSNDVNRFDISVIFLHYVWIGPLQTVIVCMILWQELSMYSSCTAGIILLVVFVPLQSWMSNVFARLRSDTAGRTDERIRIINEIVNAIRVIKMYAWEKPFTAIVKEARRKEIATIMKTNYYRALNLSLFFTSTKVVVFLALIVYVFTGNPLTAEKVYVTYSLINNLLLTMTLSFPRGIAFASETLVSCRRIQDFLEMEEREPSDQNKTNNSDVKPKECFIEAENLSAQWTLLSEERSHLSRLNFRVEAGQLTVVVGSVGSGKSSLLQALLGEMHIKQGGLKICGKLVYSCQEPWLFDGSVKQNILFGTAYNPEKYSEVIKVCSLEKDLKILPNADQTIVGERGEALSGGQKARINLARAVYSDGDIYLLDDPLSAVDMHVGNRLYEDCIVKFLCNKTRILVTHQLQFIKEAHKIIVLREGEIEAQGTYKQLTEQGVDFSNLSNKVSVENHRAEKPNIPLSFIPSQTEIHDDTNFKAANEEIPTNVLQQIEFTRKISKELANKRKISNISIFMPKQLRKATSIKERSMDEVQSNKVKNLKEEKKSMETVGLNIYCKYFQAGGGVLYTTIFVFSCITTQTLYTGSDYWLSFWTNQEQTITEDVFNVTNSNDSFQVDSYLMTLPQGWHREEYVYVYSGMVGSLFFVSMMRSILFFTICMKASKYLHNEMFSAIIQAPISFFDTHSIGSILNRFSKDIGQIDDLLPSTFYDFIEISLNCLGTIVVISYVNIYVVLPTTVICLMFFLLRKFYIASAKDVKRLEGITRSPVFSHLSASLNGLTTIRALEAQQKLIREFDDHQDLHSSSWFLVLSTTTGFGVWLDVLASIYVAVVTFSFLGKEGVLGGDVGLAVSSAMMFSSMFQWGVHQSAEVESQMTSVERVVEYSKEEPEIKKGEQKKKKDCIWPRMGKISFQSVYLYYSNDETPVLKDVCFCVEAGLKVGVVGRTGAGKTSLLTCLLRLTQPEGKILIDDVDTATIHLSDLRKSIAIIPQNPTLFNRSVRCNLDPFSNYSDEQIWKSLEEVQLKNFVKGLSGGLSAYISEGGTNLSAGQLQLICLARALLTENKIFVMDEATANVDLQTNDNIQQVIRSKLSDCTVLTIAHRLHTIIDYDKVLVMDEGKVMEYDAPFKLLQDEDSLFSKLVSQTEPEEEERLRRVAEENYYGKSSFK